MINLALPRVGGKGPRITVIGIGGAGGNAVNNMIASGLGGVEFIAANTDAQALETSSAERRIQLGRNLTDGLGAGSKPEVGEAAAEETLDELREVIEGSHMVFLAAGMGGGTGTGAAAVVARTAKELGILTVAIVTKPFVFEGARRMRAADAGIAELKKHVDTLIVIPNQNLFRIANDRTTFAEAFILADQVLLSGIACIVDLIVKEGLINLDFADVQTVMSGMGTAMMGTGEASGPRRAVEAAEEAISNPLIDDVSLQGARGVLLSIIGGRDMTLYEVDEAASRVRQEVDPDANIIVGATFDDSLGDRLRVAIVASGMHQAELQPGAARMAEPAGAPPMPQPMPTNAAGQLFQAHAEHPAFAPHAVPTADTWPAEPAPGPLTTRLRNLPPIPGGPIEAQVRPSSAIFTHSPDARPTIHWQAPGDVMIEDRSAQDADVPSMGDWGAAHPTRPADIPAFTPQPPAEARRTPTPIPPLDHFPAVGQREYRARVLDAEGSEPPIQAPSRHQAPTPAESRGGLLQRLVGRGRSREDAPQKTELPGFFESRRR
ncbi:MAG TPA: cell division protein FtsZ [Hyphomicrobiaceae bacterium]|nr:cell division protein FtsZ [Hyphomicrobiaceae bacterium]